MTELCTEEDCMKPAKVFVGYKPTIDIRYKLYNLLKEQKVEEEEAQVCAYETEYFGSKLCALHAREFEDYLRKKGYDDKKGTLEILKLP